MTSNEYIKDCLEHINTIRDAVNWVIEYNSIEFLPSFNWTYEDFRAMLWANPYDDVFGVTAFCILGLEYGVLQKEGFRKLFFRKARIFYASDRAEKAAALLPPEQRERFLQDVACTKQEYKI